MLLLLLFVVVAVVVAAVAVVVVAVAVVTQCKALSLHNQQPVSKDFYILINATDPLCHLLRAVTLRAPSLHVDGLHYLGVEHLCYTATFWPLGL